MNNQDTNASFEELPEGNFCIALPVPNYPHMHTFRKGDEMTSEDAHEGGELHRHPIMPDGTLGEAAGHGHPIDCVRDEEENENE